MEDVAKKQTNTPENALETFVKLDFDLLAAQMVRK